MLGDKKYACLHWGAVLGITELRTLAGRPSSGRSKPARTPWGKPTSSASRQQGQQQQQQQQQTQAVHGNGFTNQGWTDDDEDTELRPDGDHEAQKEVDEGYTEQVQHTLNTPRPGPYNPPMGYSPSMKAQSSCFCLAFWSET